MVTLDLQISLGRSNIIDRFLFSEEVFKESFLLRNLKTGTLGLANGLFSKNKFSIEENDVILLCSVKNSLSDPLMIKDLVEKILFKFIYEVSSKNDYLVFKSEEGPVAFSFFNKNKLFILMKTNEILNKISFSILTNRLIKILQKEEFNAFEVY